MEGCGNEGSNTTPGDLGVTIKQSPHPFLKREGQDLLMVQHLSLREAIFGFETEIDFLGTKVLLKSPEFGDIIQTGNYYLSLNLTQKEKYKLYRESECHLRIFTKKENPEIYIYNMKWICQRANSRRRKRMLLRYGMWR
jgi:hypothetical protein